MGLAVGVSAITCLVSFNENVKKYNAAVVLVSGKGRHGWMDSYFMT